MDEDKTYALILNDEWYHTGTYEECVNVMLNTASYEDVYQYDIIEVEE